MSAFDVDPLGTPEKRAAIEVMARDLYVNYCDGAGEPSSWRGLTDKQRRGWMQTAVYARALARFGGAP